MWISAVCFFVLLMWCFVCFVLYGHVFLTVCFVWLNKKQNIWHEYELITRSFIRIWYTCSEWICNGTAYLWVIHNNENSKLKGFPFILLGRKYQVNALTLWQHCTIYASFKILDINFHFLFHRNFIDRKRFSKFNHFELIFGRTFVEKKSEKEKKKKWNFTVRMMLTCASKKLPNDYNWWQWYRNKMMNWFEKYRDWSKYRFYSIHVAVLNCWFSESFPILRHFIQQMRMNIFQHGALSNTQIRLKTFSQ